MARKIYVHPGELIEVRIVLDKQAPKNSRSWYEWPNPPSMLLAFDRKSVEATDPAVRFSHWKKPNT